MHQKTRMYMCISQQELALNFGIGALHIKHPKAQSDEKFQNLCFMEKESLLMCRFSLCPRSQKVPKMPGRDNERFRTSFSKNQLLWSGAQFWEHM